MSLELRRSYLHEVLTAMLEYNDAGHGLHIETTREDGQAPVVLKFTAEDGKRFHAMLNVRLDAMTPVESDGQHSSVLS